MIIYHIPLRENYSRKGSIERFDRSMNADEVRRIHETLQAIDWSDRGTGYLSDLSDPQFPSYLELDALYIANGLKPRPSATKAELIAELESHNIQIIPMSNGFDEVLEREMQRQEEIVSRIEASTVGLSDKIRNVIASMENTHIQQQLQIILRTQDMLRQKTETCS